MKKKECVDKYFSLINQEGLYSPYKHNLRFYLTHQFKNISFDKKTVLDVGAGAGVFSFYAACMGAKEVICLEPEAAGLKPGMVEKFKKLQSGLPDLDQVKRVSITIQNFNPDDKKFDIILLHNSINHLDEEACIHLQHDIRAIEIYKMIFQKLGNLASNGAKLIITDCSRYNFFALCRIKNPFAPDIEWHKHQSPEYWAKLLFYAGFCNPKIQWISFSRLRSIGRLLLGNKFASYFLHSQFSLFMEKE